MRRHAPAAASLYLLLIVAGCSDHAHPSVPTTGDRVTATKPPNPAVPQIPQGAPTLPAPEPAPKLFRLDGAPVDWPTGFGSFDRPDIPIHANVCIPGTATGSAKLLVNLTAVEWAVHPLSKGEFWAPTAVLTVCNAGAEALDHPFLDMAVGIGDTTRHSTSAGFAKLQPGEGLGPIRVVAAAGVPAKVGRLWVEDGRRWPDWTVRFMDNKVVVAELPVPRTFSSTGSIVFEGTGGAAAMPDVPPLPLLKRLAWSQGTVSADARQQLTIFLYAPDATYDIQESGFCGAVRGDVGVSGKKWAFYTSVDGGPPVRAKEIGNLGFQGGRGMLVESVPNLSTSFLFFGHYGTCANPSLFNIYAYDHATHEFFQPQMRYEDGTVGEASVGRYTLTSDGKLTSKGYMNAGPEFGWHTNTFRWDSKQRMWLFESHVKSTAP
jgi:hypothetical protein